MRPEAGVSFVVPVHNGAACVRATLEAIVRQQDGRPMEILVVDDHSRDDSAALLKRLAAMWPIQILGGDGRGAAAAINKGVRAARFPIVCQVDQDVVLLPGWLQRVTAAFAEDPSLGAVQGCYVTDPDATLFARAMGLDLELRYSKIGRETDHVCTGNAAYRVEALKRVGGFDESLGYGYDNDMSYRLQAAGYRLEFCRTARSHHRWREGVRGYASQQYGFGYGRLDVVARHPRRFTGDTVSRFRMMAHPLLTALALLCLGGALLTPAGATRVALSSSGAAILVLLALERMIAGIAAARRFGDATALLFPLIHFIRDVVWVSAIGVWITRRFARTPAQPAHSMRGRTTSAAVLREASTLWQDRAPSALRDKVLAVIPAYNEAASLGVVVDELRRMRPGFDILVVDDGSTDDTAERLNELGVSHLRFPERLGIGNAMRAGIRYAVRMRYDAVVRIDGDGQHHAADIERLLAPLSSSATDVVIGSRFMPGAEACSEPPLAQLALGRCLSLLIGRRVTDPTSGCCAFNARAMRLLAEHHPTGYPEPELQLFLHRNHLRVAEVPVGARQRLAGRTSLTPVRLTTAGARVLLAMLIVPIRERIGGR